jgi:hypothetical protein
MGLDLDFGGRLQRDSKTIFVDGYTYKFELIKKA